MSTCADHSLEPRAAMCAAHSAQHVHGALRPSALARVRTYIDEHLSCALRLRNVAREAGLSPHHFSRCFTRSMGVNFVRYVASRRIDVARSALARDSDRDLAALAIELGYCDQAHFSNVFRRVVGTTPKRYAKWVSACGAPEFDAFSPRSEGKPESASAQILCPKTIALQSFGRRRIRIDPADPRQRGELLSARGELHVERIESARMSSQC